MLRPHARIILLVGMTWCVSPVYADIGFSDEQALKQRIGSGDVARGKAKIESEICQECHGEFGVGLSPSAAPKLAGQYAAYIIKQVTDFRSGARKHAVMNKMAAGLPDDDIADIAAFYASNSVMQGSGLVTMPLAEKLFYSGDAVRNLKPCGSCHGQYGKGGGSPLAIAPVIGGQHKIYLRGQLRNWKSNERANSPNGEMNDIARSLSDEEIDALADFISGL